MKKELLFTKNLIKDIINFEIDFSRKDKNYSQYRSRDDKKYSDLIKVLVITKLSELSDEKVLISQLDW
jgi:hypothetical protein